MLLPQKTINCRGRLLSLDQPLVMGILNLTPDSFYAGSRFQSVQQVVDKAGQMLREGADILDMGGMSSRPGAALIPVEEELERLIPAVSAIKKAFPEAILSIDTLRAQVVREGVAAGAHIINDISAGHLDEDMHPTVAELGVPYVLMHMRGKPSDMQKHTQYEQMLEEIFDHLAKKLAQLRALGIKDIVIDPGFGFGKTIAQNYELLQNLHIFKIMGVPILAGISRKSMIWKVIDKSPAEALAGTCALHLVCLEQGASILRVHDVAAARDVISVWQHTKKEPVG